MGVSVDGAKSFGINSVENVRGLPGYHGWDPPQAMEAILHIRRFSSKNPVSLITLHHPSSIELINAFGDVLFCVSSSLRAVVGGPRDGGGGPADGAGSSSTTGLGAAEEGCPEDKRPLKVRSDFRRLLTVFGVFLLDEVEIFGSLALVSATFSWCLAFAFRHSLLDDVGHSRQHPSPPPPLIFAGKLD